MRRHGKLKRWTTDLRSWRYQLEKGHAHRTGFAALVAVIVFLAAAGGFGFLVGGEAETFSAGAWRAFLHLTDAGYLGEDQGFIGRFIGTILAISGHVFFMAFLVAGTTNLIQTILDNAREGGHDVAFSEHTVIVGWNSKIFTLLDELFDADPDVRIVILADGPKSVRENEISKRVVIKETDAATRADMLRSIVYRRGNALLDADIHRVGSLRAGRFIFLAEESERGAVADVMVFRRYLAVQRFRRAATHSAFDADQPPPFRAVLEINDDRFRSHAFLAAGLNPLSDSWVAKDVEPDPTESEYERRLKARRRHFLPDVPLDRQGEDEDLTLVNGDELVSRALVQCAVQPRLSQVFDELMSFDGKDLYLFDVDDYRRPKDAQSAARWAGLLHVAAQKTADEIALFFADMLEHGQLVGVYVPAVGRSGHVYFDKHRVAAGIAGWSRWIDDSSQPEPWPLVLLGHGPRNAMSAGAVPVTIRQEPRALKVDPSAGRADAPRSGLYRVLVLGSNRRVGALVEQFAEYTNQYEDQELEITFVANGITRDQVLHDAAGAQTVSAERVHVIDADFSDWEVLGGMLEGGRRLEGADSAPYDTIVLLAEDYSVTHQRADARVILGVIMLRAYRRSGEWSQYLEGTKVVAEIIDPRNAVILRREELISDVIVSNQYVSRFVAQVVTDHRVEDIFRELLDYDHWEIYVRDPALYVDDLGKGEDYAQVIASAGRRGEVAIGFTRPGKAPKLAPDPGDPLGDADGILVIAER